MNDAPKMTPREVVTQKRNALIAEMARNGATINSIAEYFRIPPQRVTQILNREKVQTRRQDIHEKTEETPEIQQGKVQTRFPKSRTPSRTVQLFHGPKVSRFTAELIRREDERTNTCVTWIILLILFAAIISKCSS